MKSYEAIGYALNKTSAITNIVGERIFHGMRPNDSELGSLPSINYYELPSGNNRSNGIVMEIFTINSRASTAEEARDLSVKVMDELCGGSSCNGIYGDINGFEIISISLLNDYGIREITETNEAECNSPIDIQIIYPSYTQS